LQCSGWKNPLQPKKENGYILTTMDKEGAIIDISEAFAVDATNYEAS
jgi:hypothetical protein